MKTSGDSPVSNDGCGLKRIDDETGDELDRDSPVSNDGCGLKRMKFAIRWAGGWIHPSAMTGAD